MTLKEKFAAIRQKAKETTPASLASMIVNFLSAVIKILAGILSSSFYVIVNGLYSFAVGGAKSVYFQAKKKCTTQQAEQTKYLLLCGILTAASLLYLIYTLRLFFSDGDYGQAFAYFLEQYGTIFGVTLATVAFTELGFAIAGLVSSNKNGDLLKNGLKCINLASSFIAIALTQVALLTLNNETDMTFYNAIGGMVFGSACLLICAYMLLKYFRSRKATQRATTACPQKDTAKTGEGNAYSPILPTTQAHELENAKNTTNNKNDGHSDGYTD